MKRQTFLKKVILFLEPVVWLAVIVTLCLIPANDIPRVPLFAIPYFDKLVHAGMYFVLAFLLARLYKFFSMPVWIPTLLFSFVAGGLIEILQYTITTYRSGSWLDLLADLAGAILGLLVYTFVVPGRRREKTG